MRGVIYDGFSVDELVGQIALYGEVRSRGARRVETFNYNNVKLSAEEGG